MFFALRDDSAEVLIWNDTELVLTMSEDMAYTVPYGEITGVTLVETPEFGICLSGGDTAKSQYGIWQNEVLGEYVLYAYQKASPVIQISMAEEDYCIAIEKSEVTTAFYNAFLKLLNEGGYEIQ